MKDNTDGRQWTHRLESDNELNRVVEKKETENRQRSVDIHLAS